MENDRIEKTLEDGTFIADLSECETLQDVQKAFQNQGIEISLDKAKEFVDAANEMDPLRDEEISEEGLEQVSGGLSMSRSLLIKWLPKWPKGPFPRPYPFPYPPDLPRTIYDLLRRLGCGPKPR